MASNSNIQAYPFMFDPSQFADPYSSYNKMALPFMGQYSGVPTDAHGNPIQSYLDAQTAHNAWQPPAAPAQGTTLNSSPADNSFGITKDQFGNPYSSQIAAAASGGFNPGGMIPSGENTGLDHPQYNPATYAPQAPMQQQPAPAAAPTNPIDMNAAYLQALSNPGKVTTPGATVPQSAPPSNQSGVLQQFLQNWQQGGGNTQGAGNYNNKGFFNALQGQV